MWIASTLGWFSIVEKPSGTFHVRARVRSDLAGLIAAAKLKTTLHESKDADYRFRIVIGKREVSAVFRALEETINYPNFKSEIAKTPGQGEKLHAYHEIWGVMYQIQEKARKPDASQ